MAKNLAIQKIAEQYIKDLTAQELNDLLEKTRGQTLEEDTDMHIETSGCSRQVDLPNILAESEWDELMVIFKDTHPMTVIY